MSVGSPTTKATIDSTAGNIASSINVVFDRVRLFKIWLDTQIDADLITLGYTQAEVDRLRSAYVDLDKLRTIFEGSQTQSPAYDFRTFAKLIWGFGLP
jgi:hypothetical protein